MPRSLFARLNDRYGPKVDAVSRRQMLAATLAAGTAALISRNPVLAGSVRLAGRVGAGKSVVVVGAGFSGLACAYELKSAGYDVTVIDAKDRVGGRVLSFSDFIEGRNVEGGGELIGSNHPTWVAYAEKFGLEWLDVTEAEDAEFPIVFEGKRLSAEESEKLWEEMDAANQQMDALAADIDADQPWKSPRAAELDAMSMQQWINSIEASDLCKRAISVENAANNGVPCDKASMLCMLAAVKGGGVDKYWTESEVYRCKGGNQQLARKLAEEIGDKRIVLGLAVKSIDVRPDRVVTTCADNRTLESDFIVLTASPNTWPKLRINPGLPASLLPQMGTNVKYLSHVKKRFWKEDALAPDAFSDGPASMTWDGTDGQEGDDNVSLNMFSGGKAAEACLAFPKESRDASFRELLSKFYPKYAENFVKARFMDWPHEPWTMAGYSFAAPGQVTSMGPTLYNGLHAGRLQFAGEHTCYKFVGYMEGALNSGASVAKRMAMKENATK
jgi:monoamine oxidase